MSTVPLAVSRETGMFLFGDESGGKRVLLSLKNVCHSAGLKKSPTCCGALSSICAFLPKPKSYLAHTLGLLFIHLHAQVHTSHLSTSSRTRIVPHPKAQL